MALQQAPFLFLEFSVRDRAGVLCFLQVDKLLSNGRTAGISIADGGHTTGQGHDDAAKENGSQ